MSDKSCDKRVLIYHRDLPRKESSSILILAFFGLSSLFSVLAFLLALLALCK